MAHVSLVVNVVVLEPNSATAVECADCGFDAVLTFPVKYISAQGVGDLGTVIRCVRCCNERRD